MNKKSIVILSMLLVVILLIAAYPSYRLISRVVTESKIESRLKKEKFDDDIVNKETKLDSKTGKYFLEVQYKDEPKYTYTYEVLDGNQILTAVYNQENVEVNNTNNSLKYELKWKVKENYQSLIVLFYFCHDSHPIGSF